jgi:hypothetical protein
MHAMNRTRMKKAMALVMGIGTVVFIVVKILQDGLVL